MGPAQGTVEVKGMAKPAKMPGGADRPRILRTLASKYTLLTASLVFWMVGMILGYDLRRETIDLGHCVLLLVIVVLVSGATSRFTTRFMSRPLGRLEEAVAAVREGRLEPVEGCRTSDEIGYLAESFNDMIAALAESHRKIQQQNEELERRIRERTAELEKAAADAQAADKAKSEFLANVSHELRTPMNGVLGMLGIMLDGHPAPELAEQLETAQRCAYSLLALLNDILDLSKIEAGKMSLEKVPFDLREMLENCLHAHRPKARENQVELKLEISPDLPARIIGDPLRTQQILSNLVGNAVKFTEHGAVLVRTRALYERGLFSLQFTVEDSGTGIPADKLLSIFDKFTQADGSVTRRYGGTGLGLAITKKLVELHGGQIQVKSELGQGTTFEVLLPCDRGADEAGTAAPGLQVQARSGDESLGRILVVEDNPVNQRVVTALLLKRGYTIELAHDGREALEKLESSAPFDLVLMDVQMPGMDGLEATRRIRSDARWASLSIVAMTAHAMVGDRERCLEAGMDGYISKPVHPVHLLNTIDGYLLAKNSVPAQS